MQKKSKCQASHAFLHKMLLIILGVAFILFIGVFARNLWLTHNLDKKQTQDQISNLTKKVDVIHQQVNTTAPSTSVDVNGYNISQVKDAYLLVRTAATSLQHNQDTLVAQQLLQLAADHLANVNGPKIDQAKKMLAADQAKLNAVQLPNMNEIQEKLALLDKLINVLPAYKNTSAEPVTTPAAAKMSANDKTAKPWYHSITNIFTGLKSVVKVRKKVDHEINVTDVDVARAQFKLIVEQLRWAAFYNNNDVYQRSITNAQELLPRIFDIQGESTKKFAQTLQELQEIKFNSDIPNLQNSVNALQAILVG